MVPIKVTVIREKNANRPISISYYKTHVQCFKDLNIKSDTQNLTEEKIENNLG